MISTVNLKLQSQQPLLRDRTPSQPIPKERFEYLDLQNYFPCLGLSEYERERWREMVSDSLPYLKDRFHKDSPHCDKTSKLAEYWGERERKREFIIKCSSLRKVLPYFGWDLPAPPLPIETISQAIHNLISGEQSIEEIRQSIELLTPTDKDIEALVICLSKVFIPQMKSPSNEEEINDKTPHVLALILERIGEWIENHPQEKILSQNIYQQLCPRIASITKVIGNLSPNTLPSVSLFAQTQLSAIRSLKDINLYKFYHDFFETLPEDPLKNTFDKLSSEHTFEASFDEIMKAKDADESIPITNRILTKLYRNHPLLPWKFIQAFLDKQSITDFKLIPSQFIGVFCVLLNNVHFIPKDAEEHSKNGTENKLYEKALPHLEAICSVKTSDLYKGRLLPRIFHQIKTLDDHALLVKYVDKCTELNYNYTCEQSLNDLVNRARPSVAVESLEDIFRELVKNPSDQTTFSHYIQQIENDSKTNFIPHTAAKHITETLNAQEFSTIQRDQFINKVVAVLHGNGLRAFHLMASELLNKLKKLASEQPHNPKVIDCLYTLIPYMASIRPAISTRLEEASQLNQLRVGFYLLINRYLPAILRKSLTNIPIIDKLLDGVTKTVDVRLQANFLKEVQKISPKIKSMIPKYEFRHAMHVYLSSPTFEAYLSPHVERSIREVLNEETPMNKKGGKDWKQNTAFLIARNHLIHFLQHLKVEEKHLPSYFQRIQSVFINDENIRNEFLDTIADYFADHLEAVRDINNQQRHISNMRGFISGAQPLPGLSPKWNRLFEAVNKITGNPFAK